MRKTLCNYHLTTTTEKKKDLIITFCWKEHYMSDLKIGAAYIRVSTHDQEEYSPDSQLKMIRDYATKNGIVVPDGKPKNGRNLCA